MSVVAIGLNHRTGPLDLLERMAIDSTRMPKALHDLATRPNVSEAVVLSTCNRTEIYVVAERFHGAYHDVREFLSETSFLPPERFAEHLYVHHDEESVRHIFGVSAGLDSAVLGEVEILGQVRRAWDLAREEGTSRSSMNLLFRHALEVGKRARTDTAIARHAASVSTAAVSMASSHLGGLSGRRILVLGAGEMGRGMVKALAASGAEDVAIANRTWERSEDLAAEAGARAVHIEDLGTELHRVDLLLTGTGASEMILAEGDLGRIMERRGHAPLLIVDVAVPRDVDPAAVDLPGVTLLDMDDLGAFVDEGIEARRCELGRVEAIVDEELERYTSLVSAREVAPLVGSLRDRAENVRLGEIDRLSGRLGDLDDRQREAVEALTRGIVAKLLHDPTVQIKDAAGTARGRRLADAVRDLFDL